MCSRLFRQSFTLKNVDFKSILEVNMSRTITYNSQGRDITCMKEYDALKYPCQECDRTDCEEGENYEKTKSRK